MSLLGEKPTSASLPLSVLRALQPLAVLALKTWRRPRAGGEWGCVPLLARSQLCKPCHCLVEPSEVVTLAQRPGMRSLAEPVCLLCGPGAALGSWNHGARRARARAGSGAGVSWFKGTPACMLPVLVFKYTQISSPPPLSRQFRGESLLDRCVPSYR